MLKFIFNIQMKILDSFLYEYLRSGILLCDEQLVILCLKDEEKRQYTGDGSVDFKGRPVLKQNTGNWKACPFILGKLLLFSLHFSYVSSNVCMCYNIFV